MILFCLLTSVMGADCARAQEKASEKNMEVPKVYMFTKISAENLVKIYEALGREATGKVAVKLSTGEPGGHNFLQPALIKDLVKKVNGTIVECNTAYGGTSRYGKPFESSQGAWVYSYCPGGYYGC